MNIVTSPFKPPARVPKSYAVMDKKGLIDLMKRLRDKHGGQVRTARKIGISQPTLSRLIRGRLRALSGTTVRAIQKAVRVLEEPEVRVREFNRYLINGWASIWLEAYLEWRAKRLGDFGLERGWYRDGLPSRLSSKTYPFSRGEAPKELDYLVWRMRTDVPRQFEILVNLAKGRSNDEARLSLLRIFEPLLEHAQSYYIQRGADELSPSEFRQFVRSGVAREAILLKRSGDVQRAIRVGEAKIPPEPAPEYLSPKWGTMPRYA